MTRTFADHLLHKNDIHVHLDLHISDPLEKDELKNLVEDIFTHHLIDTSLTHLPKEHHDEFLRLLKENISDPQILKFLKSKITFDIVKEIEKMSTKLKKDILSDFKKSKVMPLP